MNGNNLDERQNKLMGNAMAISGVLIYIYEITIILYMLNKTKNIKTVYLEIGLIVTMFIFTMIYYIASDEYDSSIEKDNRKINLFKLDERKKHRIITSIGMGTFIAFFYLAIVIIFKFIKVKSFKSSYLQIIPLLISSIIISTYHLINREYKVPTTVLGKRLPLGNTKLDKRSRMIYYFKDAFRLSTFFLILDIINPDRLTFLIPSLDWKFIPYILDFLGRTIIFVIVDYLWGEYNIRKQRQFDESLDD